MKRKEKVLMSELVGRELKRWVESINVEELSDYEITVLNIIIKHHNELAESGGIAGGKRANKFAEYVNMKEGKCDKQLETLSFGNEDNFMKIKSIKTLSVESFRGFAVSREFNLDKQYVFLYGPNGSGKSSFSEALEYSLLGVIEEADASKIKLTNYIKNTLTKKGKAPVVTCIYEDGSEGRAFASFEEYRFAFIEKNRITDFSHISVLNSKNQSERIAALFGLSAFNEFVQGFTTNFDDKYLITSSKTEGLFNEKRVERDTKEKQIALIEEKLSEVKTQLQEEIKKLGNNGINTVERALDYLDNQKDGILTLKISERDKNHKEIILPRIAQCFFTLISDFMQEIKQMEVNKEKLLKMSLQVNYKRLYEAISVLEETDKCPVCGTMLSNAERNPFEYAREQLVELAEIEQIQQNINNQAKKVKQIIQDILIFMKENNRFIELIGVESKDVALVDIDEIKNLGKGLLKWRNLSEKMLELSPEKLNKEIDEYNIDAKNSNELYDKQVGELSDIKKELIALDAQAKEKEQQITLYRNEISEFDKQSKSVLETIKKEKKACEFNKNIIVAYKGILSKLFAYNNAIPKSIAQNLEDKIIDYYNIINQDDAEFEKIKSISLPGMENDKLIIRFRDESCSEALQVLSEGHIKILGLSILLAKAVHNGLGFIVFDDILNAIDDEHRNGVAELLMNHVDFNNTQIILSTHGEQFVFKLQDKLGRPRSEKNTVTYKFMPADSLKERGVIAEYSDAKTPLLAAERKYNENDIKDAASKCRQAMECLAYNLWNLLAKETNEMLSVGIRSPKSVPELSSIIEGLKKKIKSINGLEDVYEELCFLREQENWRILNKGTHYEDEQKEFERAEVKPVIEHLFNLDNLIRKIKITEIAQIKK